MAAIGSRIPAWKRLGLALKNEAQSGVTAPDSTTPQSDLQHQTPYDAHNASHGDVLAPTEPTVNGKPSNLGKRKHQHDEADEDGKTTKKGKQSDIETHLPDVPVITEATNADVQTTGPEPSLERAQPKGDPNYRKKKAKPTKSKRRNHEEPSAELALREKEAHSDRPALSPDTAVPGKGRRTLLASTEIHEQALAPATTPQRLRGASKESSKDASGSPTAIDRRKSVTFTPDTKRVDGSSGQDLFKKWVAEQKGSSINFSEESFSSQPLPENKEVAANPSSGKKEKKSEALPAKTKGAAKEASTQSLQKQEPSSSTPTAPAAATPNPAKNKKKDPSIYTSYLTQYHTDRDNWKFNKAKQNDVIDNALNIFRIPDEYTEALLEYVQGLKGAGVVERLKGKCETLLAELEKEDAKDTNMGDSEERQALHDEALKTRLVKEQKRRKVDGDVEALAGHANSEGYIRRLRRSRGEALLKALGRAAPILPPTNPTAINPMAKNLAPGRTSRKRKRRGGDDSSSESSSDSSSDDETSSEEESDSEDDSGSGSDSSASSSDSDGESGSGSDSDSASNDEKSESSGNDSDSDSD